MTVVGVQQKQGNYQGNDYNNFLIHCVATEQNTIGKVTEVVKVKHSKLHDVFGHTMGVDEFSKLIGREIKVNYDRFGQVSEISVLSGNSAK